ncbi:unnamed protein product, partial [Laminaria digitata]
RRELCYGLRVLLWLIVFFTVTGHTTNCDEAFGCDSAVRVCTLCLTFVFRCLLAPVAVSPKRCCSGWVGRSLTTRVVTRNEALRGRVGGWVSCVLREIIPV